MSDFDKNKTYYIVTDDKDICSASYRPYKPGVNINPNFNHLHPTDYFIVEKENIDGTIDNFSKWIREVRALSSTARADRDICYYGKSNKYVKGYLVDVIIVGKKRELYTMDSLLEFNLTPYSTDNTEHMSLIHKVIENITNDEDLIKCIDWIKSNLKLCTNDEQIETLLFDSAAFLKNTDIMNYLKENPFNFKDITFAIKRARTSTTLDYLKSKYPEKFEGCTYNLDTCIINNKAEVIQWWMDSGHTVEYDDDIVSAYTSIETLDTLNKSKLGLKCTNKPIDTMCSCFFTEMTPEEIIEKLEWWEDNVADMQYSIEVIDSLSYRCMKCPEAIKVLDWWKDSGLPLEYSSQALDCVINSYYSFSYTKTYHVIKWWKESGLPLKYNKYPFSCWVMGDTNRASKLWLTNVTVFGIIGVSMGMIYSYFN
jgi:hypothetical protein